MTLPANRFVHLMSEGYARAFVCKCVSLYVRLRERQSHICICVHKTGRQTDKDRRENSLWKRISNSSLWVLTIPNLTHVKHFHVRNEENISPLMYIQLVILGVTVRFIGCNS